VPNGKKPWKLLITMSKADRPTAITGSDVAAITGQLRETLPKKKMKPVVTEIGEITYVGDGICRIRGLPSARMEDVVNIETQDGDVRAMILGLQPEYIEAVVLGDYSRIRQGDTVRSSGDVLQVPAGEAVLGRVINPLGEPLDGGPAVHTAHYRPLEFLAPGVAKRKPVTVQLETGVLSVDTLIPLGRGQRELVIGDRKSGKTTLMTSFIINQKKTGILCVYVAIGAQKAKVRALEQRLRDHGAMDYTAIVLAGSDDSPSLNYLAPYAGAAISEHFMYEGKDVIVIYDDLSRHAKAYRQMSLLLKRSPGRDAYPGDIFYLHSRLLERSARVLPEYGGGSVTGFPMAETQNGDVSEYICTNLMSITDGHIYLDVNFLHEGILPAVNPSISVSRIGGGVQPPCLRKLGEVTSKQMARYNEVKSFENINTEIAEDTEKEIKIGKRLLEIFGQDMYENLTNDEKTLLLYLVTSGKTNNMELMELRQIKLDLIAFYRAGDFKTYKEKSLTEKELDNLIPELMSLVEAFVRESKHPAAHFLVEETKAAEKPLPIVPDPQSQHVPNLETTGKASDKAGEKTAKPAD
jgi:F-type H+-transporting ATPase subunit alpha